MYLTSVHIAIGGASEGSFRVLAALNGIRDLNNGLHVVNGQPDTNFADFSASGLVLMAAADYISVWVHARDDPSYSLLSQSRFSCALLNTPSGFGADLAQTQAATIGWTEVAGWEADGVLGRAGLFTVGTGFDGVTGRFTVSADGVYFAASQLRIDGADSGMYRMVIAVDGQPGYDNGLHVAQGNPSPEYSDFSISGVLYLNVSSYISVWVYSNRDSSFTVNSQSGFFCAQLESVAGFAAEMNRNQLVSSSEADIPGTPWSQIGMWESMGSGPRGHLFELGGRFQSPAGTFVAHKAGQYFFSAQLMVGSGFGTVGDSVGTFDVALVTNGDTELQTGLRVTSGSVSSTFANFALSGVLRLESGASVSLWVRGRNDANFLVLGQSGLTGAYLGEVEGMSSEMAFGGWQEVAGWQVSGQHGRATLYRAGDGMDVVSGRFTCSAPGMHIVSTQIGIVGADRGYVRVTIALNSLPDFDNGLHVMQGTPDSEAADLSASGVLRLATGEWISVWVYAKDDLSFEISSHSSFAAAALEAASASQTLGFGADLGSSLPVTSAGWTEIPHWETSGVGGRAALFELGTGFDSVTGRFSAGVSGIYFAASQLRLDAADVGSFGMTLVINGNIDSNNGLYAIDGKPGPDYASLSTSGVFRLQSGDFVSVWVFAAQDRDFYVNTQSGFSCAYIDTSAAFGADLARDRAVRAPGWSEIPGWEVQGVQGRVGLFEVGRNFDETQTGRFSAGDGVSEKSGTYVCSAGIALTGADEGYFKGAIALNGIPSGDAGLHVRNGQHSGQLGLTMRGVFSLGVGDFVSVWVYAHVDSSYIIDSQSGFSCARLTSSVGYSADRPSSGAVQEIQSWAANPSLIPELPDHIDFVGGRYAVSRDGVYFASAHVIIAGSGGASVAVGINLNALPDFDNGMHALAGQPSQDSADFNVGGFLRLFSGDFLSVWIYSESDVSYTVSPRSSFSCARFEVSEGFGADLGDSQAITSVGWSEVKGWETSGFNGRAGLFKVGAGFNPASGRFTATQAGVYLASAQLRLDGADTGLFRVVIGLNGLPDYDNGMHVMDESPSPDYADFSVSGLVQLGSGDYVSVWVYVQQDTSYTVHSQSGFSCSFVESSVGFAADLATSQEVSSVGWTEVIGWETSGTGGRAGLFNMGGGFNPANGRFTSLTDATYLLYAHLVVTFLGSGIVSGAVTVNANTEFPAGLRMDVQASAAGTVGGSASGTIYLGAGDFVSMWTSHAQGFGGYVITSDSGMGCIELTA